MSLIPESQVTQVKRDVPVRAVLEARGQWHSL
jgi:hypothetical protein